MTYPKTTCRKVISEDHLQEGEVSAISDAGNADDGERAGFRRHDREHDGPPRHVAVGEEVVLQRALLLSELQTERGDAREIEGNDEKVEPVKTHVGEPLYVAGVRPYAWRRAPAFPC